MCESVLATCKRFCKLTPCESEDETKTLMKIKKNKKQTRIQAEILE